VLLLKGIIERVTGKKLRQVLEEHIFGPLGMGNTTMYVGGDLLPHRATAYRLSSDGETYLRVTGEPSAYSGGGIYTTVLDLLKFDQALYGEELLSEDTKRVMFTPAAASPNYANGWIIDELAGTRIVYHGGGSGGFNSEFRRYPEKKYTVIVLSNYEEAAYELVNKLERMLLGMDYTLATETDMFYRRALTLQRYESYEVALKLFEKNLASEAPHLPSLYQIARTRILGEFDQEKAIESLDRYIALANETSRPSIAAAWWRKGVAYEQLGRTEHAITCYEKCLQLDEGREEAKEALARLRGKK
jgi:tetratricopeptide (TPR) repeat protein